MTAPRFTKSTISAMRASYRKAPTQEKTNLSLAKSQLLPAQPMKMETSGPVALAVQMDGVEAAVFEQFEAGKRGAEADAERAPEPGVAQGGGIAPGGVAQEWKRGHPGQQAALAKHHLGMQMADDRMLDLREPGLHELLAQEEGQGGGVMAEEQHTLAGLQGGERAPYLRDMPGPEPLPFRPFLRQRVRLE